jgi:hypothetical protein
MHGYIYILTNPSFEDIKIGKTSRPVEERVKELDSTNMPTPFEIYGYAYTYKFNELEKAMHKILTKLTKTRTRNNREFFKYPASDAFELLKELVVLTADGYVVKCNNQVDDSVNKQETLKKTIKPNFKFSMVGIKPKEKLKFIYNDLEVEVFDDSRIIYKGEIYSMSGFTKEFIPKNIANTSGAYQGAKYFTYNDQILTDMRGNK